MLGLPLEEMQTNRRCSINSMDNTYASQQILTDNKPDIKKMNQIVYTGAEGQPSYWVVGEKIGEAFSIGKRLKE